MTAGGIQYSGEDLADIRLRRQLAGKGFEGISTCEFSCRIYAGVELTLNPGEIVTFDSFSLPSFRVADASCSGGVVTLTAYDLTNKLGIPFDYSGAYSEQFDENGEVIWYDTTLIVGAIANQCGFAQSGYSGRMSKLCYNDFAGKTCREILTELSRADVGYWYQNANNSLAFMPFYVPSYGEKIAESDRSEIVIEGAKTISGVYAVDTVYGTEYKSSAPWENTERIEGRYLSKDLAQSITAQIVGSGGGYTYYGWSCGNILAGHIYSIGECISYGGRLLPVLCADHRFTDMGIIASLSAPKAESGDAEYTDVYQRMIAGSLPYDRSLGMQFFSCNSSGIRIVI